MQGVEPTACLVHALGYEVSREYGAVVYQFPVLERIVHLCERHGAAVEPYVNQVSLTLHHTACLRYQHDIIDIRTVEVNLIIILSGIYTGLETFILERI